MVQREKLGGETSRAAELRVHLQHQEQHVLRELEQEVVFATPVVEADSIHQEGTRDGTSVVYSDTCIALCDAETMGGTL